MAATLLHTAVNNVKLLIGHIINETVKELNSSDNNNTIHNRMVEGSNKITYLVRSNVIASLKHHLKLLYEVSHLSFPFVCLCIVHALLVYSINVLIQG